MLEAVFFLAVSVVFIILFILVALYIKGRLFASYLTKSRPKVYNDLFPIGLFGLRMRNGIGFTIYVFTKTKGEPLEIVKRKKSIRKTLLILGIALFILAALVSYLRIASS